ncbi:unnamed protein product, partial [Mesorhabditis spiculigera]
MMSLRSQLICCSALLLALISDVSAIKCYSCVKKLIPGAGLQETLALADLGIFDLTSLADDGDDNCKSTNDDTPTCESNKYCTYGIGPDDGAMALRRSCVPEDAESHIENTLNQGNGCKTAAGPVTIMACACDSDLCNGKAVP